MDIKNLAHKNALKVLEAEFFWDTSDEISPFGNDEGFDTFWSLKRWIEQNPQKQVMDYVKNKINSYKINYEDIFQENIKSLDKNSSINLIEDLDWEVIAICFGSLILEGEINNEIIEIGIATVKRQLSKEVIDYLFDDKSLKDERKNILKMELGVLEKL